MLQIKRIICTFLIVFFAFQTQAQYKAKVGLGVMGYYGDLSYENYQLNYLERGTSLGLERMFSPNFGLRLERLNGHIQGNDRTLSLLDEELNLFNENPSFLRSLNFRSEIDDISLSGIFYLPAGTVWKNTDITPYFGLGLGATFFEVFGDLYDANGNRYHYWSDGTQRDVQEDGTNPDAALAEQDGVFETDLSLLNTNSEVYEKRAFNIPLSLGLNFRINDNWDLNAEYALRFTNTDFLDDVSGFYPTSFSSDKDAYASNPSNVISQDSEVVFDINSDTTDVLFYRGSPDSNKDWFYFASLSLNYKFGDKSKFAKKYEAPTDYEVMVEEKTDLAGNVNLNTNDAIEIKNDEDVVITSDVIENNTSQKSAEILLEAIEPDGTITLEEKSIETPVEDVLLTSEKIEDKIAEKKVKVTVEEVNGEKIVNIVKNTTNIDGTETIEVENKVIGADEEFEWTEVEPGILETPDTNVEIDTILVYDAYGNVVGKELKVEVEKEMEVPSVEMPKVEAPKVDAVETKVDLEMPSTEKIKIKKPKVKKPKVKVPKVKTPKVKTPKVKTPKVKTPKVDLPKVDLPNVETPAVETPNVNVDVPTVDRPGAKVIEKIDLPASNSMFQNYMKLNKLVKDAKLVFNSLPLAKAKQNPQVGSLSMEVFDLIKRIDGNLSAIRSSNLGILQTDVAELLAKTSSLEKMIAEMPAEQLNTTELSEVVLSDANVTAPTKVMELPSYTYIVYFDSGQTDVSQSDKESLSELIVPRLQEDSSLKINLKGFADSVGDAELNRELSEKRAINVMNYILSQSGILIDQVMVTVFGEDETMSVGPDQNSRRVEIEWFK